MRDGGLEREKRERGREKVRVRKINILSEKDREREKGRGRYFISRLRTTRVKYFHPKNGRTNIKLKKKKKKKQVEVAKQKSNERDGLAENMRHLIFYTLQDFRLKYVSIDLCILLCYKTLEMLRFSKMFKVKYKTLPLGNTISTCLLTDI